MGNCSSCLSGRRESDDDDEDAEARLLFEDGDGDGYGSFAAPVINVQETAQESQREFEALQRVVARTSDSMVDVFEIAPQPARPAVVPSPYVIGMPDSRQIQAMQYHTLISKLEAAEDDDNGESSDADMDADTYMNHRRDDEPTVVVY